MTKNGIIARVIVIVALFSTILYAYSLSYETYAVTYSTLYVGYDVNEEMSVLEANKTKTVSAKDIEEAEALILEMEQYDETRQVIAAIAVDSYVIVK